MKKILITIGVIILFLPALPFVVISALFGGFFGMNEHFFQHAREYAKTSIRQSLLKSELKKSAAALEASSLDQEKVNEAVAKIQEVLKK